VGSTLWSNVSKPEFEINDTYSIKNLDIIKYNTLNQQSISFLEDNNINKMIIITHHVRQKNKVLLT